VDTDGDHTGNHADTDDDGDGVADVIDSDPLNPAVKEVVPLESGEPSAAATITPATGSSVEVDNNRLLALDAAATELETLAAALPAEDPGKAQAEADAETARALVVAATKLKGTKVEIPAGTTVDGDGDGAADDSVDIGIEPADAAAGGAFTFVNTVNGSVETTIVGQPVAFTPAGATFDLFARLTLAYTPADLPYGLLDEADLAVVRTNDDGTKTLLAPCDDTIDRNGNGAVNAEDQERDCVEARDTAANTITVRTSHFSTFTVAVGDTDGDGIADTLDANPTVPQTTNTEDGGLGDRNLFSRLNENGKNAFGCAATPAPSAQISWGAVAMLLLPLGLLTTLRNGRRWMRTLLGSLLLLALCLAQAEATTTLFPTGFGAKMAAMGGAGNAAGDDATTLAVNPANVGKMADGWRVDLDVGALIFNGSYTDHNSDLESSVNRAVGGRFEINEGTLFFLPTVGIVYKTGRLGVGFGMWGKGGGGFAVQDWGFNDVTPVSLGGGRESFITNGSDLTGSHRLTGENAVRRDNYTLMIIGRFGLALSYDLTDDLTVAVEPLQDYGFLKFGIFGSVEMAPHGVQARHVGSANPNVGTEELGIDGIVAKGSRAYNLATEDGMITRTEAKIALGVTDAGSLTAPQLTSLKPRFDRSDTVAAGKAFNRFLDPAYLATQDHLSAHEKAVAQNTAQGFPSHGQLFAGRTFPGFIFDRQGPTAAADDQWMVAYDGHGGVTELPVDGVQRVADFFHAPTAGAGEDASTTPAYFRKQIWEFSLVDDPVSGEQRGQATGSLLAHQDINSTLNNLTRSLMAQPFYDSTKFTDAEHDYVIDEFYGLFQDVFPDFGFGMGEVTGYASGRGFEDFANAVKVGGRWRVNDWLSFGGSYTSKSSIIMRDGGLRFDFTNQIQQGLDVGMRSLLAMQTVFDELGMTQFAEFVDTVADGVATDPTIQNVDFAVAPGSDPTVTSSQQIFNELPKLGNIDRLLTEAPSFGDATHGPGNPDVAGSDRAIPTNPQLDLLLTGSSGRADDNFTNDDAHSVELLTRSGAGLFHMFASLMGYIDNQEFQNLTSQPNYKVPKRTNDSTNNTATLGINAVAGTFHNGSGTIVRATDDQEVIDYYRDIARFLRGFGVSSIADPDSTATQAVAVAQVQGLLDPANYATPEEFLTAYDGLRNQFNVVGDFRTDITVELPQQVELGIEVRPSFLKRLRLTSDVKWADYSSSMQQFAANLRNPDNPVFSRFLGLNGSGFGDADSFTFKEDLNWHDQWIFNFGTGYDLLDNFTVMAGYSFTGRRLNDLWNDFGKAKSAMDGANNMGVLPAFGFQSGSVGASYRWNNKELSVALERAFTTTLFSDTNLANSQYSDSRESANQESVHVQYSLMF